MAGGATSGVAEAPAPGDLAPGALSLDDLSLDDLARALAPGVAQAARFDGWNGAAVEAAAAEAGVAREVAALAFRTGAPGTAMRMIGAWIGSVDEAMVAHFGDGRLAAIPIRARIRALVWFRLEAVAGLEEAVRRAQAVMAMPRNVPRSLRLGWSSADAMWRLAGDAATDLNHYSKRAILAGLYAASLAVWVDDESAGKSETAAFLARRIDGVMRFEKAKARWSPGGGEHFSPLRFLGRLRYPPA